MIIPFENGEITGAASSDEQNYSSGVVCSDMHKYESFEKTEGPSRDVNENIVSNIQDTAQIVIRPSHLIHHQSSITHHPSSIIHHHHHPSSIIHHHHHHYNHL